MITRLNIILLLVVLGTAMLVVQTQYQSRQLFTEFHRAELETRRLDTEFDRLQVERRAQATPLRIEKLAKEQLKMRVVTPAITQYVRPDGSVIPAIVAPPPEKAERPEKANAHGASAKRSAR